MSLTNPPESDASALEAALKSLVPAAGEFDRDAVLFRAGQVAGARRARWILGSVAAVLALTSTGLALGLAYRPEPQRIIQIVELRTLTPATVDEPAVTAIEDSEPSHGSQRWWSLLRQREQLTRWEPSQADLRMGAPVTPLPSLERQLGLPPRSLTGPQFQSLRTPGKPGESL
jgi:hypothetical protein